MDYFKNFIRNSKNSFNEYNLKVNWLVFLFVVIFTVGSWIDINGTWCELPIMVHELPERWRLPSILSAAMQLSQLGPLVFLALKCLFPKRVTFTITNYIILSIGATSCFLLSFLWRKTAFIAGEERSIALYTLQFTLGLLDGTSSVTFLPYIGKHYHKEYIIPTYVGESLSAMIPSLVGIIQGVGTDPGCREINVTKTINGTVNATVLDFEAIPLTPRFSVSIYFLILCAVLILSTLSFSLLNFTTLSKNQRKTFLNAKQMASQYTEFETNGQTQNGDQLSSNANILTNNKQQLQDNDLLSRDIPTLNVRICLCVIIFFVSFFAYGLLPAIQSYSTLPYGNSTFHLSINISYTLLPIVILASIWSYNVSCLRIIIEFLIAISLTIYIIVIANASPCPPLLGSIFGQLFIIISWIVTTCLYMRIRCIIAAKLEVLGQRMLLFIGFLTMFGQMVSGLIMYFVVNHFKYFQDAPQCRDVIEYCKSRPDMLPDML